MVRTSLKKDNRGMTMAEVIVGFVILLLIIGMLSGIIAFARNMYFESVDLRKAQELFQAEMYKSNVEASSAVTLKSDEIVLVPRDGSGKIKMTTNLYEMSSNQVLSGNQAGGLDVKVCFVKDR